MFVYWTAQRVLKIIDKSSEVKQALTRLCSHKY